MTATAVAGQKASPAPLTWQTGARADTTAPVLNTASVDWTRVTLTFDEVLDTDSAPALSSFSVAVGGSARALAGVSLSEDSAVLALTSPVSRTDTVTVAYQAPTEVGLRDKAGNAVASFAATSTTNDTPARLATQGRGLGNFFYTAAEAFTPVSWIRNIGSIPGKSGTQFGTNVGILLNGYFVTLFAPDSGRPPGGFLVYDVSDPRNLREVRRIYDPDDTTRQFRESHSLPTARIKGSVYVAVQSTVGVEFWDFTNVDDIHRESTLMLPGVQAGDYHRVAWQLAWQAPYLYVAASSQGIYIVDASDPAAPFIANRGHRRPNPVPPSELGGFKILPIFAMGNHLVVTGTWLDSWSSIDISDPLNPVLLDTQPQTFEYYAPCFDGRRIYIAPRQSDSNNMVTYDLSNPDSFVLVNNSLQLKSRLYCGTQDRTLFQGGSSDFRKIDVSDDAQFREVGRGVLSTHNADAGQVAPMGNLVFVGNDHGTGSAFMVHDTNPDLTPPQVTEVSPRDGAVNQAVTSRIGIAFSDSVLLESVGSDSVRVLDPRGNVVTGTFSAQLGIVNFSPEEPLQPNTTYTVKVPEGGVSDYAGNRVKIAFSSTFATGEVLPGEPVHRWVLADDARDWFDRNNGVVVGATFENGGGLRLDGQGDWIELDDSLSPVLSGNAALAFFLSTTQTGSANAEDAPGVTGRNDTEGTDDAFWGWLDDTGRLRLSVGDGEGIESPEPVNDGELHHYVLTRADANGSLVMYRNGVKVAEGTGDVGARDGGGSYRKLGAIQGSASLSGVLEDVQIFNKVLSSRDVALLYGVAGGGFTRETLEEQGLTGVASEFEAQAQGDGTTTYQWDFGDGSVRPASISRSTSHTYARPGHYTVRLSVTSHGDVRRYTFVKTVSHPRTGTAPSSSSGIAGNGQLVYIVNPDNGSVTAIHRTVLARLWETRVGKHPRTVAVDTSGRAWVAVQGDDRLVCLDTSGAPCGTIGTGYGSAPFGVAFVPGTDTGLVTLQGSGEVLRFDAAAGTVLSRQAVNAEPRGIAIAADGTHAYVTRLRSTAAGLVNKIDTSTLAAVSDIALEVDSTTTDAEDRARGKPNYLTQVVISPDGRTAWVPSKQDNVLRGERRDGLSLTHDSTVRTIASLIDLAGGRELPDRRIDFNDRADAVALAFSPRGDYAFVALQGSNSVAVVDAYSGAVVGALEGSGLAPHGIWIDESGRQAFVSNFTTRSVAVYDITNVLDSVSFEPALLREIKTVEEEIFDPQTLRGLQIFYNARDPRMSRDGYISCASCHLDGGEDGTVWDFADRAEGLRNTIALNGRKGTAFGNLHWTANFDEIQDFENDIRNAFGGLGFMTDVDFNATSQPLGTAKAGRNGDLDALAAYVSSLDDFGKSPHRTADGDFSPTAAEGRRLFAEMDCGSCHAGVDFTDRQRHDVGTAVADSGTGSGQPLAGVGFKTPTLLGVWRTAPYFHNGSAATLAAVVDSRHGGERALASAERDKLVAYLRSLERPMTREHVLSAVIESLPDSHDGSTPFTFQIRFSKEVVVSYTDFEGRLFELSGGAVQRARRLNAPSNIVWEVTVRPAGDGPVTIVLPANRDCGETAAVCTQTGTRISQRLAVSVSGPAPSPPPVANIAPGTSPIAEGAVAAFTVSLDTETAEAVSVSVTVTQTGDVLWGSMPESVTFAIGESRKSLALATVDDMEAEREGTVTMTLSAGTGYTLGSATVAEVTVTDNDPLAVSVANLASSVVEGEPATYELLLTGPAPAPDGLTVALAVLEAGSFLSGSGPASVTFAAGETRARLEVATDDDAVVEADGTVTATLVAGTGYTLGSAISAEVTVTDDDVASFAVTASPSLIEEGGASTVTLSIDNGVTFAADQAVTFAASGIAADQYRLAPETVTLSSGATSVTATLEALTDRSSEEPATVTVTASVDGAAVGSTTVTVEDPAPAPTIAGVPQVGSEHTAEPAGAGGYEWLRAGEPIAGAVAVRYAPVAADVGSALSVRVQARGRWRTSAPTIPIWAAPVSPPLAAGEAELLGTTMTLDRGAAKVQLAGFLRRGDWEAWPEDFGSVDDAAFADGRHELRLLLVNGLGKFALATSPAIGDATDVTAYWNEHAVGPLEEWVVAGGVTAWGAPSVPGAGYREYSRSEGVRVAVSLRRPLPEATLTAETDALTEGASATYTVALDRAAWSALEVTVSVTETGSMLSGTVPATVAFAAGESTATLTLATEDDAVVEGDGSLTVALVAGDGYLVGTAATAETAVTDDDEATLEVSASPAAIAEGAVSTLTVSIANGTTFAEDQRIELTVSGTAVPDDYRLSATSLVLGAGTSSVSATLTAVRDVWAEAAETVTVTAAHGGSAVGAATVTIAANEAVVSRVTVRPVSTAVAEGAPAQFEVRLDAPALAALEVAVSASETGSMLSGTLPSTVAFAVGESSRAVSLATVDDTVVESDSAVTLTLGTGSGYVPDTAASAVVTVEDDDTATFDVSASSEEIDEGEETTLTVSIGNGVTFAGDQAIALTVSGTATAADYRLVPEALTLTAGASLVEATLTAVDDTDEEPAETITVTAAQAGSAIGSVTVTVRVSDVPSDDATLSALVLSGIDIGTFTADGTDYTAAVETAIGSVTVTATANDAGATLVIADGSGSTVGGTRTVSLAEGDNAITVTVTAEDDETTRTYRVTVTRAFAAVWGERLAGRDIELGASAFPSGLWSDGSTLWVIENWSRGAVRAYALSDGSRRSDGDFTLRGGNGFPSGLWSDGETLWVADHNGGVTAHRLSDGSRLESEDLDGSELESAGNLAPTGLWSDGETLWVADHGAAKVFAYRLTDKTRRVGKEFALVDRNGTAMAPFGLWSDGELVLASNFLLGGVLGYGLSDGSLRAERSLATSATGTANPMGLWSDGRVLWVVDDLDRRAYAYAVPGLRRARVSGVFPIRPSSRAFGVPAASAGGRAVWIPDGGLRLRMAAALGKPAAAPIGERELAALESLDARGAGVRDLTGLAYAVNLTGIDLGDNAIADLRVLAELPVLTVLNLDGAAADVWPLARMSGLKRLSLRGSGLSDVQALGGLTALRVLDIGGTGVADLTPLGGLPDLEALRADGNGVEDTSALDGLERLRILDLGGVGAEDRSR